MPPIDPNATNTIDAATFNQARGVATLPSGNADSNGMEPTQSSPTGDQLSAPAARPATPPMQMQPSVSTPAQSPSPNSKLHGFINSVLSGTLSALAGRPATKFITDSSGRVVPDPNQGPDSNADKGRRLAAHALEGLGAGAQVQNRGSGLANALAGLGAGASAVTADQRAMDDKARQKTRRRQSRRKCGCIKTLTTTQWWPPLGST
jgi:hypothetical protein